MSIEPEALALDLSGVQPAAVEVVRAAAAIYLRRTAAWFIGLIAHGSAYKGDFIPGCSDVDLKLYLRDDAFVGASVDTGARLPFALAAAIQRDLAQIDPAPFQYIQCYAQRPVAEDGRIGPVAGAYHLLLGRLPVAEATAEQLRASSRAALDRLDTYPTYIATVLLEHGGGKLERAVRFACTDVWPILYQTLCLQQPDPIAVWGLPKRRAIALLPAGSALRGAIEAFHAAITAYYCGEPSIEQGVEALGRAIDVLTAARAWWDATSAQR